MQSLLEKYWDWKNTPTSFKTERGLKVKRFGDKFAVKVGFFHYQDLSSSGYAWTRSAQWFKDCVANRAKIEEYAGAILGLPEDNVESGE